MSETLKTNLDKPIATVTILDDYSNDAESVDCVEESSSAGIEQTLNNGLKVNKAELSRTCQMLKDLVAKFNQFSDKVISEHREAIAKLSVEIARKILVQKVRDGDYEIESVIKEALKNAPSGRDIVVHLNPGDLERFQKVQENEQDAVLSGIKFVSDPNVGQAECVLESPKGIIKSLIDEHLEQISRALKKAE